MRQFTDEERSWLNQFDRSYKRSRCHHRRYGSDTMNKIRVDGNIEGGIPFPDNIEELLYNREVNDLSKGDLEDMKQITRPIGIKSNAYTSGDYYALPSLWYSGNWVDKINDKIDKDRGKQDEDTGIPGISNKNGTFKVCAFFNSESVDIGEYATLERAKKALIRYNQTVTTRGFGVDYNE